MTCVISKIMFGTPYTTHRGRNIELQKYFVTRKIGSNQISLGTKGPFSGKFATAK